MVSLGPTTATLVEQQTRFLYPFFFKRRGVSAACTHLQSAIATGREGHRPLPIWEPATPHHLYQEEILDPVIAFLFGHPDSAGCVYSRLTGAVGARWFNAVHARLHDGMDIPIRLTPLTSIELFLSNHGTGVLSLGLSPDVTALDDRHAIAFNYRLSQLRPNSAATLYRRDPAKDPDAWALIPEQDRARIAAPPEPGAPIEERLGTPGASFLLKELVDLLLRPLARDLGLKPAQSQFSVYTTVRFTDDVDLNDPHAASALSPLLSALAQIEEPAHTGARVGDVGVPEAVLNRRHWACVGRQGTVHLVADQPPPELSFNTARVPRVMMKYFIPYLVALLQRTTLQRIVDDSCKLILSRERILPRGWRICARTCSSSRSTAISRRSAAGQSSTAIMASPKRGSVSAMC